MTNLEKAVQMLREVDFLIQEQLGGTSECYELYNAISDIIDRCEEIITVDIMETM